MNNFDNTKDIDDMQPEYDFSKLKGKMVGKYYKRYQEGTNIVLLDADVYESFPDSKSVNDALRMLIQIAQKHGMQHQKTNV